MHSVIQYRSASLSINPAFRASACSDCEYIECTIAIIIIVIAQKVFFDHCELWNIYCVWGWICLRYVNVLLYNLIVISLVNVSGFI